MVTNRSAVTRDGTVGLDALLVARPDRWTVFAPEHGLLGNFAAGAHVPSAVDEKTGIPVRSLYGNTRKPSSEMLEDIDAIVIDLQDVGARFYTYLYTMAYVMQAGAESGIPVYVLDRPNPIGGIAVEGPILDPAFSSFVGLYPIPIRTGMTIGETALLFNGEFGIGCDLRVEPMAGWRRPMWFDDTGLPWVAPSPAIIDIETAAVYPGMCLIEGTNLSEGRGTDRPFRRIGAPWIDARMLSRELARAELPGVVWEPVTFVPATSKYPGEECQGVEMTVTDRQSFLPVRSGLKLIELARRLFPGRFDFSPQGTDGRSFFDLLAGSDIVRKEIERGDAAEDILEHLQPSAFLPIRSKYLLYT